MKLCLLVLTAGKQEGKKLEIKVSPFLIGRDAQCHLRPASPLISKKHCAFIQRDGKVFLQDFDSTNGSLVNGEPIQGEVELKDKDRIKIGPIELQVVLEAVPEKAVEKKPAAPVKKPVKKPVPATTPVADAGTGDGSNETIGEESTTTREEVEASAGGGEEDDIAAMLLALGDDTDTSAAALTSVEIPDGSTIMEMKVPEDLDEKGEEKDQLKKAKEQQASTSQAARDILSKYMRRPRG